MASGHRPDTRIAVRLIDQAVSPLWDRGRNTLLGWRSVANGIDVLMVPYDDVLDHAFANDRLLHGKRHMGDKTFRNVCQMTGRKFNHVPLAFRVADEDPGAVPASIVEQVLQRYSITETKHRAVALFDIVGYSTIDPLHQVAQLNNLECSINDAYGIVKEIGLKIDLARSTTGDGYYLWNRAKGVDADLATFLVMLLTLADNSIAHRDFDGKGNRIPILRAAFAIGSHYLYYQVEGLVPRGYDYIVGNVTISLARLIDKCLPGQILLSDFERPFASKNSRKTSYANAVSFVAMATRHLMKVKGQSLHGDLIKELRCYLTGREEIEGEFGISRFEIKDKHGYSHGAFNQKLNLYTRHKTPKGEMKDSLIYLGKQTEDLTEFQADETIFRFTV